MIKNIHISAYCDCGRGAKACWPLLTEEGATLGCWTGGGRGADPIWPLLREEGSTLGCWTGDGHGAEPCWPLLTEEDGTLGWHVQQVQLVRYRLVRFVICHSQAGSFFPGYLVICSSRRLASGWRPPRTTRQPLPLPLHGSSASFSQSSLRTWRDAFIASRASCASFLVWTA